MSEPLRRRLRSRLLAGLSYVGEWVPRRAWDAGMAQAARLMESGTYGDRARANLQTAYGDQLSATERDRILRGAFRHSSRLLVEWLRLARGAPPEASAKAEGSWIEEAVRLDPSLDILKSQLARGRGAILVTPHLGNWELLAARLRLAGFGGAVVGRKRERDSSSDWMVSMRRAYGVATIPQDASPRRALEVLRNGGALGLLPDLEVRRLAGEFLPFFGVPALTMTAPAALARAHGVPLLPVRCVLPPNGGRAARYTLSFEDPLELSTDLSRRAATTELTLRLSGVFERWIRETPEQWAWHQHRWRTRPGEIEPIPLAERQRRKRGSADSEGS